MTGVALIVVCVTTRGMGDLDICALEGVLAARRAVADDRAGGLSGSPRCFLDTIGRGRTGVRVLIYTIEVIKIAFTAVGC